MGGQIISGSAVAILKLIAEEKLTNNLLEYNFWRAKTERESLIRDGAIHLARDILGLENIEFRK